MRRLATLLFLCGAASVLAQQSQVPPPAPPLPPPEGAPMTPALARMIQGRGDIVRVITGFGNLDGIVWRREDGLVFADTQNRQIVRWMPDAKLPPSARDAPGGAAGLTLDAEGRLIAAEPTARRVTRTDKFDITTLVDSVDGAPLRGPTDVAVAPDGSVYVVDADASGGRVIRVPRGGAPSVVLADLAHPAGIAVAASGASLFVADAATSELWSYPLANGNVGTGRKLATIRPWKAGVSGRPDGLLVDRAGHVFLAGPGGVWVLDENGGRLGVMALPETPSACTFGDADGRALYITAETSVYKVRLRK